MTFVSFVSNMFFATKASFGNGDKEVPDVRISSEVL